MSGQQKASKWTLSSVIITLTALIGCCLLAAWANHRDAIAATSDPTWVTGNFPRDLYGPEDTRPQCYGHAEAAELPIKFTPPAGHRVKVLQIRGDLVSWPEEWVITKCKDIYPGFGGCEGDAVLTNAPSKSDSKVRYSGLLVGFSTTEPGGSKQCDWCADNTLVYVQDGLRSGEVRRTPFDWKLGRVLPQDHTLVLKIASWLNTTGYPIHMEATWQAKIQYVAK